MAGVRLEFAQFGHFDYFKIYRNSVSTAIENLGEPIGSSSTMYYKDLTVESNQDYYYRAGVVRNSIEEFSGEFHVKTVVEFDPPYNLIVEFKNDETNRLELNWNLDGFIDEQRYYCSETPIDSENLPVPKAVLVGDVLTYVDTAVEAGKDYYVAISSVKNGVEKISEIVSVSTWSPHLIAKAWYDFSDESTVTLSDNAVSQITDKSVNNYHLSQSIATRRPLYVTLESGKKSAKFDGIDDFLYANAALLNIEHSLFIVFKPTIESVTGSLFGQWASGQTGRYILSTNQNSAGETSQGRLNPFNSTATDGGDTYGYIGDFAITNEATIIESICTTGFKNWKVYKNGLLMDSATVASLYTGVNSAIGSVSASQILNPYDGHVGEIIIVDSVVDTETRQKIEGYLAHKWGVAI